MGLARYSDPYLLYDDFMDLMSDRTYNMVEPDLFNMVALLRNCQGLSNDYAVNTARDLVEVHQPDCLILTETRMSPDCAQSLMHRFPFDGCFATNTTG